MRLRARLLLPPLGVLAFMVAAVGTQAGLALQERRVLSRTGAELEAVERDLRHLEQLFAQSEREVLRQQVDPDAGRAARLAEARAEVDAALGRLARVGWPARGARLVRDLDAALHAVGEAQEAVLARTGTPEARGALVRWGFVAQRAGAMLADLSAYNVRRTHAVLADMAATRTRFGRWVLGLTVAAALLTLGYTAWVVRQVVRPITLLTRAGARVGAEGGDAAAGQVPRFEGRTDELGVLSRTLADMTGRLTGLNTRLREALAARDHFLAIAAHELKTPLTSLKLQLGRVRRQPLDAAGQAHVLGAMERQVDRVSALVEELLDVARLQAGRLELALRPLPLAHEVQEALARCEVLLATAGCEVEARLDAGVVAHVDVSRFDQVVVNLLSNAAKYAPGAPLRLTLAAEDGWAVLRVHDGGPGFPQTLLPRLFQQFGRPEGARAAGLGLGLFLSRRFAEAMGGSLEAENAPEGGARLTLRLPRVATAAAGGGPVREAAG